MIYWKTNLKWTLKMLSLNKNIKPGIKTRIDPGLYLVNIHFTTTR